MEGWAYQYGVLLDFIGRAGRWKTNLSTDGRATSA